MTTVLLDGLYSHLPSILQDFALTIFGLRNVRRNRDALQTISQLEPTEYWTPQQQRDYVERRLSDILRHAFLYVPFYKPYATLVKDLANNPEVVFQVLEKLPAITKLNILAKPEMFFSSQYDRRRLKRCVTSGTTGTPFATWLEPSALRTFDALSWRRTLWAGYESGDWIARLVGDPIIPVRHSEPSRLWRVSYTDRRLYLSSYHLGSSTAESFLACLNQRKPAFLMGYPSTLQSLTRLARSQNIHVNWTPKAILYSSEPMYDNQRKEIQEYFQAPVRGFYGNAERVVSASDCEHGTAHLNLLDGYVEGQFGILRDRQPALVTGLLSHAMPLIRYELGDEISLRPTIDCPCGRTLPIISPVVTKAEDTLLTPSGRTISPSVLTWAFKDLSGIRRSQVIQIDSRQIEVLIETSDKELPQIRDRLQARLHEITFHEFSITLRRVKEIQVTSAGKTRFVVNKLPRRNPPPDTKSLPEQDS